MNYTDNSTLESKYMIKSFNFKTVLIIKSISGVYDSENCLIMRKICLL